MTERDEGFDAYCRRTYPRLIGVLTFRVGRIEVAEELAQEALARAHLRWDEVARMDRPEAWVHRVALNLASSWWRRSYAERRANARSTPVVETSSDDADALVLRSLIAALPVRQRTALSLRYYAGLSVAETAHAMSCREGTVKALTHQGIARLREHFDLSTLEVNHG